MPTEFKLPELGENITAGDVLRVMVAPGDTVQKEQPVVELETDKATIEVPSSIAGVVTDVRVKAGDKVKVGQAILVLEESGGRPAAAPAAAPASPSADPRSSKDAPRSKASDAPARVPADGALDQDTGAGRAQPRAEAAPPHAEEAEPADDEAETVKTPRARRGEVVDIRGPRPASEPSPGPLASAAPSVRRMARELGVDINDVPGSGPGDRISVEDVKDHAKRLIAAGSGGARAAAAVPLPDFSKWGEVERRPMRAVRRKTAQHLAHAWATIPHVTQHDRADVTDLEQMRQKYAAAIEKAGGALTLTAILVKIVASALKVFPQVNSSIDLEAEELVFKKYVHVGVAVDTERGLLVPVIRDADRKNIAQISVELAQLAEKARSNKLTLPELDGGSFTITNLGGIGGTAFSPIVNAPEVAILGVARASTQPVWAEDRSQFEPRLLLPLSLSYDHRVIDGADGIRFLRWVVEAIERPLLLALQG